MKKVYELNFKVTESREWRNLLYSSLKHAEADCAAMLREGSFGNEPISSAYVTSRILF